MDRIDRRTYLTLIAGATVVAGCLGDGDTESSNDGAEASAGRAESRESNGADGSTPPFEIGDRIDLADLQFVVADSTLVENVDAGPEPEDDLEADEGDAFAVTDLAVRHADDEGIVDVAEAVTVRLRADDGDGDPIERVTEPEIVALDPTERRLAPGELVRGDLVAEVEESADGLVLELESLTDETTAVVDLESNGETGASARLESTVDDVLRFAQGVEHGGIEVTVSTLEHGNNLGGFMQSDEGHEIVAVGVTVENGSGRDRTLSTEQIELKDEFGRLHAEAPGVLRALEVIDGVTVADGEEHDGKIAYQLEEGREELYWVFDFAAWGEDRRESWQLR
ncbi:DUF4352 domain-containing protein [Natronolimnohabitans innermongolicus]|uniref:DUF4352 domain-containing protein n=1 Tax=Natronolimnohabitans innermongolicus JCM 12255 TaxID=1227499 RepID=L9WZB3_9EURY|nr:DUF4352 domain-containing protein [Natronolimnohabitans innermongolicus]ELY54742.1 hypothetical protein C493_12254 [Natronolimnohabitans innermongolicus JCM 12255]